MSNWCRGTLEVRGNKDNIERFLLDNFKHEDKEVLEDDRKLTIRSKEGFYIEGTKRNFVNDDIEFNFATEESTKQCTLNNFMAAWFIDPEPYAHISKKYDIDIEIFGIEVYGGFTQEIEIQKGEVIKDKVDEINFDFRAGDDEPIDENMVPYSTSSLIDSEDDLPF